MGLGVVLWHPEVGLVEDGKVDGVADVLEDVTEGVLVLLTGEALGKLEVDFGEVHAHGLRDHSFEESVGEVEAQTVALVGSGRLELTGVDTVDVEGDPVFAVSLMVEILMNGLMHSL